MMVYSTYRLLPSENENQIKQFLQKQEGKFELPEQRAMLPSQDFDEFFMARFKRQKS